jgi:hypothetical protein
LERRQTFLTKLEKEIEELVSGELDPESLLADKVERRKQNNKFGVQQKEIVFRFSKLARKLAAAGYFLYVLRSVFEYLIDFEQLRSVKGLVSSKTSPPRKSLLTVFAFFQLC